MIWMMFEGPRAYREVQGALGLVEWEIADVLSSQDELSSPWNASLEVLALSIGFGLAATVIPETTRHSLQ